MNKEIIYNTIKEELNKFNTSIEVREQWDNVWDELVSTFYSAMTNRIVELEQVEHPEEYNLESEKDDENDL